MIRDARRSKFLYINSCTYSTWVCNPKMALNCFGWLHRSCVFSPFSIQIPHSCLEQYKSSKQESELSSNTRRFSMVSYFFIYLMSFCRTHIMLFTFFKPNFYWNWDRTLEGWVNPVTNSLITQRFRLLKQWTFRIIDLFMKNCKNILTCTIRDKTLHTH